NAALALFDEAFYGPTDPRGTMFVDNEAKCGFIGVLEGRSAAEASRPLSPPDPITLASHVGHVHYSLTLVIRSVKGELPYSNADWAGSWGNRSVDDEAWSRLIAGLRSSYEELRGLITAGAVWRTEDLLTETLAQIAHGAWHLGAIRQGLGMVRAPRGSDKP
ncbi:MAG TPA: hypothetical protein VMW69_10195, partial [Spirochaetia bacterium]|nr:hypothetical protein [Spirochaetia bacterium]